MAGVNFKKFKGGTSAKARFRHCGTDTRLKDNHSNRHINKDLTPYNMSINVTTYAELCNAYDSRLAEVEKTNTNKRKDRVDCFGLEIPIPDGVDFQRTSAYFQKVTEIVEAQYGSANVLGAFLHVDEVHTYIDTETANYRNSLKHIHLFVIPEHNGSLNGKWFSSKVNMTKLNKSIDEMTKNDFNCSFMTGTKKKSKKSVEELKNESELLEQRELQEIRALKQENKALKAELLRLIDEYTNKSPNDDFYNWCKDFKTPKGTLEQRYLAFKRAKTENVKKSTSERLNALNNRLNASEGYQSMNDVLRDARLPTL